MTYTNRPVPQWGDEWRQPVTFETPSHLTGAALTDGRGLLMWVNADRVRWGIVSSPSRWLQDGSCTSASTLIDGPANGWLEVASASCFRVGSDLFALCFYRMTAATSKVELYKADSASNPTSWSLHSVVQGRDSGTSNDVYWDNGDAPAAISGIPYVSGSRWLLPHTVHERAFSGGSAFNVRRAMLYISDDDGTSFVRAIPGEQLADGTENSVLDSMSTHVARDPATGDLLWYYQVQNAGRWRRSSSSGDISTWTLDDVTSPGLDLYPFMDDGVYPYLVDHDPGSDGGLYRLDSSAMDLTVMTKILSFSRPDVVVGKVAHICQGSGTRLYLFAHDRVLNQTLRRPTVGRVGSR